MKTGDIPAFLAVLALCLPAAPATAAIGATAKVKVLLRRSTFSAASDITSNACFLKNVATATLPVSVLASEDGADHAPFAEAGPDQTVKAGTVIPLDGSLSSDEDGDPLTCR